MPREISFFDAYVPTVLLAILLAGVLALIADRILSWLGLYRLVWHPALFRISLFTCIAALLGLAVYS
jgi:hypothetical protein